MMAALRVKQEGRSVKSLCARHLGLLHSRLHPDSVFPGVINQLPQDHLENCPAFTLPSRVAVNDCEK